MRAKIVNATIRFQMRAQACCRLPVRSNGQSSSEIVPMITVSMYQRRLAMGAQR